MIEVDVARNISPAAERMRRHRERRRDGLRCLTIELRETEVGELIRRGYLSGDDRTDPDAIIAAFYRFLDRQLAPTVTRNAEPRAPPPCG
jgi:hypothetical protein